MRAQDKKKRHEILCCLEQLASYYHSASSMLRYIQLNPDMNCQRYQQMAETAKEHALECEGTARYLRRAWLNN